VTTPNTPTGPSSGYVNTSYNFLSGGSTCSHGHSVEYQFDWGDGSQSSWGASSVFKAYDAPNTYNIKARARCTVNTSITSGWSGVKSVSIILPPVETPTFTPDGGVYSSGSVQVTITCATAGATVRYTSGSGTTPGADPTTMSPEVPANGSVNVPVPGWLKAKAWKDAVDESAIKIAIYNTECEEDADCDDGLFCNGEESCAAGLCVPGVEPCGEDVVCDEENDQCVVPKGVLDTGDPAERVCNPKSYTDLGNGIIRDNVTGLEWQQATTPDKYTWQQALDYVDDLNDSNYLGYDDWRLPSIEELSTLVAAGRYNSAIGLVFSAVASGYWSSTPRKGYTNYAWIMHFYHGVVANGYDKSYNFYVRAVRSGPYRSFGNYFDNNDGTITDTTTGLMWQAATAQGEYTWQEALDYVDNLNSGGYLGYTDWRLPTRNELQSLVDYSRHGLPTTFPNTVASSYWSSTAVAGYTDYAWYVFFGNGYVYYGDKSYYYYVRAVRGGPCGSFGDLCIDDSDCDDGLFCNGMEICSLGSCVPGVSPCFDDEICDEAGDQCVECLNNADCGPNYNCSSNVCVFTPSGTLRIDKANVKAGKFRGADSLRLSGTLNATEADLLNAVGGTITVVVDAEYVPDPRETTFTFQVPAASVRKGKYKSPKDPVARLSLDTIKGTLRFAAKNVDLTGLGCPITVEVQFGDYAARTQMGPGVVNGSKPCPLPLMMGVKDTLSADKVKAKKGKTIGADSISISGTFTAAGGFNKALPVIITLGPDTFTIPGNDFILSNGRYLCKSAESGNGLITARFDTVKCTYSIRIKGANISGSGNVAFGVNVFGNALQASGPVTLPFGF
jgi:hypothetical protein